jgi:hypothetical protein
MSIKVPEGLLLPAGPVHKPLDSILQVNSIEVYKQAEGFATQFEVGNHLSMVTGEMASTGLISTTQSHFR